VGVAVAGAALLAGAILRAFTALASPAAAVLEGDWYTYANGDDILCLKVEGDILWAGTRGGGVVRWNSVERSFVQYLRPQDGLVGNIVHDVDIDEQGNQWFATDLGVSVLDDGGTAERADDRWHSYTRQNTGGGLPSNDARAVAIDQGGIVWLGTAQFWDRELGAWRGGGLTQLDTRRTLDSADDVWVHTYTFANTQNRSADYRLQLGLVSDNVSAIVAAPGPIVWVGTQPHWLLESGVAPGSPPRWARTYGGLSRVDTRGTTEVKDDQWQAWSCRHGTGEMACAVPRLALDPYGYLWVSMRGRGVVFTHASDTGVEFARNVFTAADGLPSDIIDAIAFGQPDDPAQATSVWLAGRDRGVGVLDHRGTLGNRSDDVWNGGRTGPYTLPVLPSERVFALATGRDRLWVGTGAIHGSASGIGQLSLTTGRAGEVLRTTSSGPPSNFVTALAFGPATSRWHDQVWLGTGSRTARRYGDGPALLDTGGTLDPADDTWRHFSVESTDDNGRYPWTGLVQATWDRSRRAYSDGGLSVFDGIRWSNRTVETTGGAQAGMHSNNVAALAVGCRRELWIGSGDRWDNIGSGIDVLSTGPSVHDSTADAWSAYRYPNAPSDNITALVRDCNRDQMWVAGAHHIVDSRPGGGGVAVYDYARASWTRYDTRSGLVSYRSNRSEYLIDGEALSLAIGPAGSVWVGTYGTLETSTQQLVSTSPYWPALANWYAGGTWSYREFPNDGWVSGVAPAADGSVWLTTSRGGLARPSDDPLGLDSQRSEGGLKVYDGQAWFTLTTANSPLPADDAEVIATDPRGDIWIGTQGHGLIRYHPRPDRPPSTIIPTSSPVPTATPNPTSSPEETAVHPGSQRVYLPRLLNGYPSHSAYLPSAHNRHRLPGS
jgi:ligand-binding sensor domain-containing protein